MSQNYTISYKGQQSKRRDTGLISQRKDGSFSEIKIIIVNRYNSPTIQKRNNELLEKMKKLINEYYELVDNKNGTMTNKNNRQFKKTIIRKGELQ